MTFREIINAHNGYINREINDWKRTRWQAAILANVIAKSIGGTKKTINPQDLLKLPDDGDNVGEDELEKLKEMRKWRTRR